MTPETLNQAVIEAKRFLKAAKDVPMTQYENLDGKIHKYIYPGKISGACRRASMDLTPRITGTPVHAVVNIKLIF